MKAKRKAPLFFLLILALCALALSFWFEDQQNFQEEPEQDHVQAISGLESITLTEDFKIICMDPDSPELLSIAAYLQSQIMARTGLHLQISYTSTDSGHEILLGYCPEQSVCAEAYGDLTAADYEVYASGNKIVLGAYSLEDMRLAAELLLDRALTKSLFWWQVNSFLVHTEAEFSILGDLSGYQIVYPAQNAYLQSLAKKLQASLNANFGVLLPIVEDSAAGGSAGEIILGSAPNTAGSAAPQPYEWCIAAEDQHVYLYGGCSAMTAPAIRAFCEQLLCSFAPNVPYLKSGVMMGSTIDTQDTAALAEGAQLRIMSYNILHENWSKAEEYIPVEARAEKLAAMLLYYRPDVVGIQELSVAWYDTLKPLLLDTGCYQLACDGLKSGTLNMTCFLYNPETVELLSSSVIELERDSEIRLVCIATFRDSATSQQFIVTNAHPAPAGDSSYQKQLNAVVSRLTTLVRSHPKLPVIMTGDFNTKESSSFYGLLLTMPVRDAKYAAETLVRNYESYRSNGWNGSLSEGNTSSNDHIFCTDNVDVLLFNTIIDNQVDTISDHLPIYADISFK